MKPTIFRVLYAAMIVGLLWGVYMTKQAPNEPEAVTAIKKPMVDKTLQSQIETWVKDKDADFGIAVQEITGQQRVARHQAQKAFPTASTYKLFVAYGLLHQVEKGELALQHKLESGDTVQTCLRKMIVISDNTCGRALGFLADWKKTEKLLKEKDISKTYLNNYDENNQLLDAEKTSTAQDHVKLLRLLQRGELLNRKHADLVVSHMKKQQWRERIPAGVPKGVEVADKPGFLPGMQNDAAIVYGPKSTYVITILSSSDNPEDLADLSKLVYNYLQK